MSRHDALIARAVKVAQSSDHRWQHGAVAVRNGQVLNWAPNKFRNSPWISHEHASRHAEVAAVAPLRRRLLSRSTLCTWPV